MNIQISDEIETADGPVTVAQIHSDGIGTTEDQFYYFSEIHGHELYIQPRDLTIKATWHDGEYLSAYEVFGEDAKLLEQLGLARWVSGWGYKVDDAVVKALGTEFSHRDAIEYAQPARLAKINKIAAAKAARQAKFDEAARTGKRVVLSHYTDDCDDPREECDLDNVTEYAMPDGTVKVVRSHTW